VLLRGGSGGSATAYNPGWAYGAGGADPEFPQYTYNGCNGLTCSSITINTLPNGGLVPNGERFKVLYSVAPDDEKMDIVGSIGPGATHSLGTTTVNLQYAPAYNIKFVIGHDATTGNPGLWVPIHGFTCQDNGLQVPCNGAPSNAPGDFNITTVVIPAQAGTCAEATTGTCNEFKIVYDTPRGSWEWIVGGRDAGTSDQLGMSYVTEAFDSLKNIETTTAGFDMQVPNSPFDASSIPFVLEHFNLNDDSIAGYRDCGVTPFQPSTFGQCQPDPSLGTNDPSLVCPVASVSCVDNLPLFEGPRIHLRDDWSSILPVDSSDIILVGGPIINGATEMANDWASIIYRGAQNDFWGPGLWDGNVPNTPACTPFTPPLGPSTCTPTTFVGTGFAVIETYMDPDGTVYFIVYGNDAQDTYWATWLLLHDNGNSNPVGGGFGHNICNGPGEPFGFQSWDKQVPWEPGSPVGMGCGLIPMEHENPGVTGWIIGISYDTQTHIPTFQLEKRLDTFSEKQPEPDS
jgi:hypothetical protein